MLLRQTFHRFIQIGIVFIFLISLSQASFAQEKVFVQFLIPEINTDEQALEVDSLLTSKSGVQFTRYNFINNNLLLVFNSSENYVQVDFELFLSELDLNFVCYTHGILGIDTMKELTISECSEYKPEED